jgi:hypothetical protein
MNNNSVVEISDARLPGDIDLVRQLWTDYLTWGNDKLQMLYGVHPHNPEEAVEEDLKIIDKFLPPNGRLKPAYLNIGPCTNRQNV